MTVLKSIGSLELLKVLPSTIASFSKNIPPIHMNGLLSLFTSCTSHKLWIVRKAAVEELKTIAQNTNDENSQSRVFQLLLIAMEDSSKWVRQAAKLNLGYVMGVLPRSLVCVVSVLSLVIGICDSSVCFTS